MAKPISRDVALIIAGYSSIDEAESDWKQLKDAKVDGDERLYDLAVIGKADDGTVAVLKDLHHKVRRGAVIGAVVALATPVGLVAGLAGGAVAGKIGNHFHKGMSEHDKKALGDALDRHSVSLIALADADLSQAVTQVLHSDDVIVQTASTEEQEVKKLLAEF